MPGNKYEFVINAKDKTAEAFRSLDNKVNGLQNQFVNLTGAVAALTGGLALLTSTAANNAKELDNLSRLAKVGVEDFQAYAFAFDRYNISAEKLADISKDVNDKLGDFIATGGGAFADFFEKIGPQVGLTSDELQNLSGPDALIAVKKAMDAANVSMEEQTFYLESIANDATLLIPALENGGAAIEKYRKQFEELGLAITADEIQQLRAAELQFDILNRRFQQLSATFASELSPELTDLVEVLTTSLPDAWKATEKVFMLGAAGVLGAIELMTHAYELFLAVTPGSFFDDQVEGLREFRSNLDGAIDDIFEKIEEKTGDGVKVPVELTINEAGQEFIFYDEIWAKFRENLNQQALHFDQVWLNSFETFSSGLGSAVATSITQAESFSDAMENIARSVIQEVISGLVTIGVKKLALATLEQTISATAKTAEVASAATVGTAVATSWAPAAAMVSLASFGANSAPASLGIASTFALSEGLALTGVAHDGIDNIPREGTYLLDRGERVIDSRTNADLKNYLSADASNNTNTSVHFHVPESKVDSFWEGYKQNRNRIIRDINSAGRV